MAKDPVKELSTRLYVGGLFCEVTDADLIGRFEKFGQVSSVDIVRRTDDKGKPERTFAYVNLTTTDQKLKKCMAVYNKSKWKGHDMQIQVAKESFLARLAKEREATKMELSTKKPPPERPEPSPARQCTVQGAVPGTEVEGERNWVVGKYGRILPVVYIRRKDKKKVMKVNPSKYSHNLKKVKEEHFIDPPISQLTWDIQVQGTEESRKKRQGDFSDFMKGRWKRSGATLQAKNKKMKIDVGNKSEEHFPNSNHSDPNTSSHIGQSGDEKDDKGVLDGNMLLGFKTLVHNKQGGVKGEDDSDRSVDTDELLTATKHQLVQYTSMEETFHSGTDSEMAVSSRKKLQRTITTQDVNRNSSSKQDSTDDESEDSDDAEMIAAARLKLQVIMSSPTVKNEKQGEKDVGLNVPVTTEHKATEQVPMDETRRRKDSSNGIWMSQEQVDMDIGKGPADRQKLKSSSVGEVKTLANEQRLESLRQRQLQGQSKQALISKALSTTASSTAGKHTVFDSEDEDSKDGTEVREEAWSSTLQHDKAEEKTSQMAMSKDSRSSPSLKEKLERRYASNLKPDCKVWTPALFMKCGRMFNLLKLLELQAQIGQDDRFRMDHRFLEEDSDGEEQDMKRMPTLTEETDGDLEAERQKSLEILRRVVGTKAAMATEKGKNIDKLKFKDPSAVRYDPTREDHKQFEIPDSESQKDVEESSGAGTHEEAPPEETVPNITKDKYFQVATDLKEAFSGTSGQTFSFFGPSSAETTEDIEADMASVSTQTAPKKSPWQPKVFQKKTPEKVEEPKKRNSFFFTENDSRLKEGILQFYRTDKLEDIRQAWEEVRPELLEESKKRHKNAVRQRKKNQKNRPRHRYK
ncbi:nucleolar protein 8 [Branchiostoma belcheri]|nr:nucleolar protein 8 [Branchiostoma belcheri]